LMDLAACRRLFFLEYQTTTAESLAFKLPSNPGNLEVVLIRKSTMSEFEGEFTNLHTFACPRMNDGKIALSRAQFPALTSVRVPLATEHRHDALFDVSELSGNQLSVDSTGYFGNIRFPKDSGCQRVTFDENVASFPGVCEALRRSPSWFFDLGSSTLSKGLPLALGGKASPKNVLSGDSVESLTLERNENSKYGNKGLCSLGSFPELRHLWIRGEGVELDGENFPALRTLCISLSCVRFKGKFPLLLSLSMYSSSIESVDEEFDMPLLQQIYSHLVADKSSLVISKEKCKDLRLVYLSEFDDGSFPRLAEDLTHYADPPMLVGHYSEELPKKHDVLRRRLPHWNIVFVWCKSQVYVWGLD